MYSSRCDIETTDPWDWHRVCLEHKCGPKQAERCNFFFFFSPLLHTVCGVEGVDSCGTPDSSWESTNLWPPSQLPCCVFLERVEGIIWILYECGTRTSISGEVILGEKMCSEMLFNLLWRILIGLGDVNQIFNYCMLGHIEKKSLHSTGLCVCIYSGFCYCFVSLLNCWLIINQAVCVLVLRQQRIISERIVCSAVTDHSHDGLLRFVLTPKQKPQPVFVCALWFLCVHSRSSK